MLHRHDDARRHHDGSIDFDFYRRRAARLRRAALADLFAARVGPLVRPVLAVAVMLAALMSLPSAQEFERLARRPAGSSAVAPVAQSAQAFRRAAAERLGSVRLRSRDAPWPHDHP